ncbi:MAG: methyl-accepting chemotaxis protein, partial [Halomonas sp.]
RVTDIMKEISNASAEQSAGVQEVGQAVTEMDQVTQQNASLVNESATAANNLRQNAHKLIDSMSIFKLPTGGADHTMALARASATANAAPPAARPALRQQKPQPEWESF